MRDKTPFTYDELFEAIQNGTYDPYDPFWYQTLVKSTSQSANPAWYQPILKPLTSNKPKQPQKENEFPPYGNITGAGYDLNYSYGVGETVFNPSFPGAKFEVVKMKPSAMHNYGGYEINVKYLEGLDRIAKNWSSTLWEPAAFYYPAYLLGLPKSAPKEDRYPHKCPYCQGKAYIGFTSLDCIAGCRDKK